MRRAALALILVALTATPAHAGAARACTHQARTPQGVHDLIVCAAPKMGVSTSTALAIAWRESRYRPWADNPRSSAAGVFQTLDSTWAYFVAHFRYGNRVGTNVYSGRDNVILSLRYARAHGWGPWGG